jgi:hypothetical protein
MRRRKWDEDHQAESEADELEAKRREREERQAAIDACPLCDEFGDITFDDAVKKCDHPKEAAHA